MSPSPSPRTSIRDFVRWLFLGQEPKPSFDLPEKILSLIESLDRQGLFARLHKHTEKPPKEIRKAIEERVEAKRRESGQLAEALRSHQATSDTLRDRQKEARQVWAKADLAIIAGEAVLSFFGVTFVTHLVVTAAVFAPGPGTWAAGAAVLLGLGVFVGLFISSSRAARERALNAGYASRWYPSMKVGLLYFLAGLVAWWTSGAIIIMSWLQQPPPRENLLLRIAGLVAALAAVYVGYRWLEPRFLSWQAQANAALKPQEQELNRRLDKLNKEAEDILTGMISKAKTDLERKWQVPGPNPWAVKVPPYPVKDAWRNLSEQYDSFVNTKALSDLKDYLEKLKTASIGIAGERGAGKTSVMVAVKKEKEPKQADLRQYLTIWISAPTAYKEKEFLLSILAKLASRVGARLTGNDLWPNLLPEQETREADRERRTMIWATVAGGLTLAGVLAALIYIIIAADNASIPWANLNWLSLPASIALVIFLVPQALRWRRRNVKWQNFGEKRPADRPFLYATHSLLQELWFEYKEVTSSEISGLTEGLGVGFTAGVSEERTKRPFTLPRLVQMWDDYVEHVVTAPGAFEKVVVFIDEVDKIKETAEIGRFMRILKTLFKPSRLFFVVSISEDAYDQFQVRGVRKDQRNEFDSSFDQLIIVKRMTYENTKDLLIERIIGDPPPWPFVQLIWAISKGNARDSIRLARDVLQWYQRKKLSQVTRALVRGYSLKPLLEHARVSLQKKLMYRDTSSLFQTLEKFSRLLDDRTPLSPGSLAELEGIIHKERDAVKKGHTKIEDSPVLELQQLRADLYYALTLCETFDEAGPRKRFRIIGDEKNHHCRSLLVHAQHHLEDGLPELAWNTLNEFRRGVKLPIRGGPSRGRPRASGRRRGVTNGKKAGGRRRRRRR